MRDAKQTGRTPMVRWLFCLYKLCSRARGLTDVAYSGRRRVDKPVANRQRCCSCGCTNSAGKLIQPRRSSSGRYTCRACKCSVCTNLVTEQCSLVALIADVIVFRLHAYLSCAG